MNDFAFQALMASSGSILYYYILEKISYEAAKADA